ncbi:hypothetical protein ATCV1_Z548L [Acanthocystis turfacea chlorella virus 1]|uniref:Uncharacterized protein Z548L n=1 Tax=Chlorovirus heliozoae TaxID=322019 RepID=A7K9F8_9PHYC|nr:hypothetical protein ATCV1_Z548L [Acanthocystis turfacea chlorella virus 1]ABT16682.1 hypothetical protein ATCV1_Z548L [Acanthocystis turfacea chlorella virus 1]
MGFIYMLTSPSGKSYIGQTTRTIEERLKQHQLPSNKCIAISNAIQKYGWENFEKHWYEVPDEELNEHEELMIEVLGTLSPSGYNLKGGGGNGKLSEETKNKISEANSGENNPMFGKCHTDETKKKFSEERSGEKNHMFGKHHAEETKKKLSEDRTGEKHHMFGKRGNQTYMFGKHHTEETKQKISKAVSGENNPMFGRTLEIHPMLGKHHSDITKQKISEALSGGKHPLSGKTGDDHHSSKTIHQYTKDGIYITSFGSCREAARVLNKSHTGISKCGIGKHSSAYGFKWSYTKL